MALARIRQLAAHETGHTLGLMHNYAASIVNRSSVMDYPSPTVSLGADGRPDVSDAYAVGIGEWDKVSIMYGYSDLYREANEPRVLDKILSDAFSRGLLYLTDQDARPLGSPAPWRTSGTRQQCSRRLESRVAVRAAALKNLRRTQFPSTLRWRPSKMCRADVSLSRYQVMAVAKSIGGLDYSFNLRGIQDQQKALEVVPAGAATEIDSRGSQHALA